MEQDCDLHKYFTIVMKNETTHSFLINTRHETATLAAKLIYGSNFEPVVRGMRMYFLKVKLRRMSAQVGLSLG
jgi:23S rRNA U2552 (ribose-2'-O)-methylase RlmE/FtsJ